MVDLCSRRVVGWAIDVQITELLVRDALQHAILFTTAIAAASTPVKPIALCSAEQTSVKE
ncbi:hypothetical protein NA78x_003355 [Anatilimnocola sp. NA78]|uniref:hypothetical protein n=1 Tax=Anatilimnocola sp. NA78 TaxID=3415683 RepID=UPI003CE58D7A